MKKLLTLSLLLKLLTLSLIVTTPLWYDENYTLAVLRLPLPQMLAALQADVHPPLWYLLARPFAYLGPAWAIRLPSLVFACTSLVLMYLLLQRLLAVPSVKQIAFVAYALTSTGLFYASEGRMYAWLGMLLLAGSLAVFYKRPVWLGLVMAVLLWSHNYGIFYTAALWLAAMFFHRERWRAYTLAASLAGLSFMPWMLVLAGQMSTISGGYWISPLTPANAAYAIYESVFVSAVLRLELWTALVFWGWLFYAVAWNVLRSMRLPVWHYNKAILSLALLPFALAVIGSVLWRPILLYRALTPCVPFLLLFMASPFQVLDKSDRRPFLLGLVLIAPVFIVNAVSLLKPGNLYRGQDSGKLLSAMTIIETGWQTGDVVLHQGDGSWVDLVNYSTHPESFYKAAECGPVAGSLSEGTRLALGMQIVDPALLTGRVWYITEQTPMSPVCDRPAAYALIGDTAPLVCLEDNLLARQCLYLLEFPDGH